MEFLSDSDSWKMKLADLDDIFRIFSVKDDSVQGKYF